MNDDDRYMRLAIETAKEGIAAGQSPFGAVIVREGTVVVAAHNTVWRDTDPTAHAEVNAIRKAAARLGRIDLHDCTLFSTCEPCPMCLAATHWSKIERLVYGATIDDAAVDRIFGVTGRGGGVGDDGRQPVAHRGRTVAGRMPRVVRPLAAYRIEPQLLSGQFVRPPRSTMPPSTAIA